VRPNPLSRDKIIRLRGNRPAGPPPRPKTEPIRVQRRASATGVIVACGQKVALGRIRQHQTLTVHVSDTTLAIELDDGETRVVRRTTTLPVHQSRPATDGPLHFLARMSHIRWRRIVAHHLSDHTQRTRKLPPISRLQPT
jgi:hypothetical protein